VTGSETLQGPENENVCVIYIAHARQRLYSPRSLCALHMSGSFGSNRTSLSLPFIFKEKKSTAGCCRDTLQMAIVYGSMYVCMHVCMCVCMCVYVCMYPYVCMYVCMYVCVILCMYVCMYVCLYVCMYACMHVCMYACMRVCMYACMHVCMYAFIHSFRIFILRPFKKPTQRRSQSYGLRSKRYVLRSLQKEDMLF